MVRCRIRIKLRVDYVVETTRTFKVLVRAARLREGCMRAEVLNKGEQMDDVSFFMEWKNQHIMRRFMRTSTFRQILILCDLAKERPEVSFEHTELLGGFEYLSKVITERREQ